MPVLGAASTQPRPSAIASLDTTAIPPVAQAELSTSALLVNPCAVAPVANALLEVATDTLSDPCLQELQALIDRTITESTVFSKSSHEMKYQECFAVRPEISGMLDVARKAFLQSVEEIHALAEEYARELQVPVKVTYTVSRGYFLVIPADTDPLPGVFTQAVLNKKSILCSTVDVASLSSRATESMNQALVITNECIQSLMGQVRVHMEALFSLTDCVALIDMLTSFADLVSFSPHMYTRPRITPDGPLVIHAGRHPVLSDTGAAASGHSTADSFVPNDVYFSPLCSFQVITGPNGAGKTVFIKQVTLITILAQIGCFIPARHGTIPIRDRILTRLGTSDDMEHNLSSFMTEMKETAYILNNLTPRSLVIIDELGRGTSNIDGLSLAFAIAEALVDSAAYCMFVTHYTQVTSLASMYPNASNVHLKVALETVVTPTPSSDAISQTGTGGVIGSGNSLRFTHQVGSGPSEMKNGYGILMSEICGFPAEMVEQARNTQKTVRNLFPLLIHVADPDPSVVAVSTLLQHLLLLKNSSLNDLSLVQYLCNLRCKLSDALVARMQRYIASWSPPMNHALCSIPAVVPLGSSVPVPTGVSVSVDKVDGCVDATPISRLHQVDVTTGSASSSFCPASSTALEF